MIHETELKTLGLKVQPPVETASVLRQLLDADNDPIMRVVDREAELALARIGRRLSDPSADRDALAQEAAFWSRARSVFSRVASNIADRCRATGEDKGL